MCRAQATRWHVTATEMFSLPLCESRSETQRTKRPGKKNEKPSTAEEQKQNRSNSRHNETRIQQEKTTQNFISQGSAAASCCFLPRLLQSILRRRRRFGCCPAQHTSALTHHDKKKKQKFSSRKKPQTSSHKAQYLQAAVSFHGCCNRFCAVVADFVALLHSTRQRSRTTIKKETKIQQEKTTQNFISQGPESASCRFLPRLLQSILRRRRRFGCSSAQHTSALAQRAANNTRKIHSRNRTGKNITRSSLFTLLISPVFTRAANRARSAAGTPQLSARITSESTSNSLLPNFTFAMEYAAADAGPE